MSYDSESQLNDILYGIDLIQHKRIIEIDRKLIITSMCC